MHWEKCPGQPWLPLHVERGCAVAASTGMVTAFACEGPRQVRNGLSQTPEGVLTTIADVMSSLGTSLTTSGSVASTATGTRQGEIAIVMAGSIRRPSPGTAGRKVMYGATWPSRPGALWLI